MPQFIDIQINGYAGVDFLGPPVSKAQFDHVATRLRAGDVRAILLTVISDEVPLLVARLQNFRKLIDAEPSYRTLFPAFHIEGPCLSAEEGYRGAHRPEAMRPASPEIFKPIADAVGGWDQLAMVTIAPERDEGMKTIEWLTKQGVIVALGHTNASLQQLRDAESAGAQIFTHFGNGCYHLQDRHDNVLNRAMTLEKLKFSLIPDGHHLPFYLVKNWLKYLGIERCVFTTDCVAPADAPPGRYTVAHHTVEVTEARRVQPAGKNHLAGSALTMREAYDNAIKHVGLTPAQAKALTEDQPAALIKKFLK
jgi:N-acetylglucosamine-6-phosphate deacetylase